MGVNLRGVKKIDWGAKVLTFGHIAKVYSGFVR